MTTKISGDAGLELLLPNDIVWYTKAIGEPFALRDDLIGVDSPPTDNPIYRYIKLTAGDAYNDGVLGNEIVSGSAPLVIATAEIILAGSPLQGATVNLWNTERRSPRAGESGALQNDQYQTHNHDTLGVSLGVAGTGVVVLSSGGTPTGTGTAPVNGRHGDETRIKNQGVTYYMRIK